jgi:hypothetical protein
MPFRFIILLFLLFSSAISVAQTSPNTDNKSLENQRLKLDALRKSLERASQERNENKERLEALKRRLDCNWSLIQAYDACETRYHQSPDEQLQCKQEAKRQAETCLGSQ